MLEKATWKIPSHVKDANIIFAFKAVKSNFTILALKSRAEEIYSKSFLNRIGQRDYYRRWVQLYLAT